ncbi:MAG: DUF2088 domain-containing protein [Lachnospiraceae bacterium]|nr:DUF2088 domain-containing protein [Lachnospiraceae bacterium]
MKEFFLEQEQGISSQELRDAVRQAAEQFPDAGKVLIIPPDYTRCYSFAGEITRYLYEYYQDRAQIDILPGVGTHLPMTREEQVLFIGEEIPESAYLAHDWKKDVTTVGVIPKEEVGRISGGLYAEEIKVELDHRLVDGGYDVIFSPGQVVPHEAAGMANYSKNLFIGTGGQDMISKLHMLCSICFTQMGEVDTVMRKAFDYAQERFIDGKLPVVYLQTVVADNRLCGLYTGMSRKPFEAACALSQKLNIVHEPRKAKKVVAYLDPEELRSFWVGNKAIYRSRMLIAEGGELLILAPGVVSYGEVEETESGIREFGYRNRQELLDLFFSGAFGTRSIAAGHLLLSTPDGHFTITYATKPENLSKEAVEAVYLNWMDYEEAIRRYDPAVLKAGWNTLPDGEEIYYIPTPALGLWEGKDAD